jgi:hypothetical protein
MASREFLSIAHHGISKRPKTMMRSHWFSLHLAWKESRLRTMARETRSFFRRMKAILNTPSLSRGPEIPRGVMMLGENLHQENKFQVACNENMRRLKDEEHWPEYLDLQIAAISFQRGAQWAYRTYCNRTDSDES